MASNFSGEASERHVVGAAVYVTETEHIYHGTFQENSSTRPTVTIVRHLPLVTDEQAERLFRAHLSVSAGLRVFDIFRTSTGRVYGAYAPGDDAFRRFDDVVLDPAEQAVARTVLLLAAVARAVRRLQEAGHSHGCLSPEWVLLRSRGSEWDAALLPGWPERGPRTDVVGMPMANRQGDVDFVCHLAARHLAPYYREQTLGASVAALLRDEKFKASPEALGIFEDLDSILQSGTAPGLQDLRFERVRRVSPRVIHFEALGLDGVMLSVGLLRPRHCEQYLLRRCEETPKRLVALENPSLAFVEQYAASRVCFMTRERLVPGRYLEEVLQDAESLDCARVREWMLQLLQAYSVLHLCGVSYVGVSGDAIVAAGSVAGTERMVLVHYALAARRGESRMQCQLQSTSERFKAPEVAGGEGWIEELSDVFELGRLAQSLLARSAEETPLRRWLATVFERMVAEPELRPSLGLVHSWISRPQPQIDAPRVPTVASGNIGNPVKNSWLPWGLLGAAVIAILVAVVWGRRDHGRHAASENVLRAQLRQGEADLVAAKLERDSAVKRASDAEALLKARIDPQAEAVRCIALTVYSEEEAGLCRRLGSDEVNRHLEQLASVEPSRLEDDLNRGRPQSERLKLAQRLYRLDPNNASAIDVLLRDHSREGCPTAMTVANRVTASAAAPFSPIVVELGWRAILDCGQGSQRSDAASALARIAESSQPVTNKLISDPPEGLRIATERARGDRPTLCAYLEKAVRQIESERGKEQKLQTLHGYQNDNRCTVESQLTVVGDKDSEFWAGVAAAGQRSYMTNKSGHTLTTPGTYMYHGRWKWGSEPRATRSSDMTVTLALNEALTVNLRRVNVTIVGRPEGLSRIRILEESERAAGMQGVSCDKMNPCHAGVVFLGDSTNVDVNVDLESGYVLTGYENCSSTATGSCTASLIGTSVGGALEIRISVSALPRLRVVDATGKLLSVDDGAYDVAPNPCVGTAECVLAFGEEYLVSPKSTSAIINTISKCPTRLVSGGCRFVAEVDQVYQVTVLSGAIDGGAIDASVAPIDAAAAGQPSISP